MAALGHNEFTKENIVTGESPLNSVFRLVEYVPSILSLNQDAGKYAPGILSLNQLAATRSKPSRHKTKHNY